MRLEIQYVFNTLPNLSLIWALFNAHIPCGKKYVVGLSPFRIYFSVMEGLLPSVNPLLKTRAS
jgi:hypothetical protein